MLRPYYGLPLRVNVVSAPVFVVGFPIEGIAEDVVVRVLMIPFVAHNMLEIIPLPDSARLAGAPGNFAHHSGLV